MLLGEGKQAHDKQGRQDASGYQILRHGCCSTGLATLHWKRQFRQVLCDADFARIVFPHGSNPLIVGDIDVAGHQMD